MNILVFWLIIHFKRVSSWSLNVLRCSSCVILLSRDIVVVTYRSSKTYLFYQWDTILWAQHSINDIQDSFPTVRIIRELSKHYSLGLCITLRENPSNLEWNLRCTAGIIEKYLVSLEVDSMVVGKQCININRCFPLHLYSGNNNLEKMLHLDFFFWSLVLLLLQA